MTNDKKIRIFYILSALGMVIGMITIGLCLIGFNVEEYGNYNLFTTFTVQLGILSFGYQDGMLINYRKKQYHEVLPTLKRDIKFGFIFQTIILLLCVLVAFILPGLHIMQGSSLAMLFYAMLNFYPITLLNNIRNALSATGRFNVVGYIDFFTKVYLFFSALLVVIFKFNVTFYILIDLVIKLSLVAYLYFMIFKDAKGVSKEVDQKPLCSIKDNFRKGLWILLGNWAFILVFSLDRNMLQNHPELIGIYSYAMFVISTIYQLLTPLKPVLITQVNEFMSKREVFFTTLRFTSILFIVSILYILIGEPIASWLVGLILNAKPALFANPDQILQGISISSLLVIMLPLYVCINIFFNALLIIKNQRQYAIVEITNAILSVIVYVSFITIFKDNILMGVVYGSITNYFVSFIYNSIYLSGVSNSIKLFAIEAIAMIICFIMTMSGNYIFKTIGVILMVLQVLIVNNKLKAIRSEAGDE